MSTTYTANLDLPIPGVADRNWNVQVEVCLRILDGLAPIGGLAVTPRENPSASLALNVAAGTFRMADGTVSTFAGSTGGVSASNGATRVVYLDGAGNLLIGASYPTSAHVRLARVAAAGGVVTSIADDRVTLGVMGTDAFPYLKTAGGTLDEGANVALGTGTGTRIATASGQRLGFWGQTPITRPSGYTQSYTVAARAVNAYAASVQTTAFTGIASGVAGTPYAQLSDLNALRAAYENLRLLAENVAQVLNSVIDDLQAMGLLG